MIEAKKSPRFKSKRWSMGSGLAVMTACALIASPVNAAQATPSAAPTMLEVFNSLRPDLKKVARTESLERATSALQLAADLKLPQASKAINEALQLDPSHYPALSRQTARGEALPAFHEFHQPFFVPKS